MKIRNLSRPGPGFEPRTFGLAYLRANHETTVALDGNRSMFRRSTIPKVLYSEGPVFRRSYVPKLRGSMFRRFYVRKVLCSEKKLKVPYSEGPIFRRFYVPKNWKVLYSESSMFRNFRLCIPLRVGCRYEDSHGGWT